MGITCAKPLLVPVDSSVSVVYKRSCFGYVGKVDGTCGSFCKSATTVFLCKTNVLMDIHAIHSSSNSNRFYI
jgi:hypothetical protein